MKILKIGGGLIAPKNRDRVIDAEVLKNICKALANSKEQLIVIHGAGSFGHTLAKKYEIHKGFLHESQVKGLIEIRRDMEKLNHYVVNELNKAGLPSISMQSSAIFVCSDGRIVSANTEPIRGCLELGITPVLYGDVVFDRKTKFSILSGDQILGYLFNTLKIDINLIL